MATPADRNRGDTAVHVGDVPAGTSRTTCLGEYAVGSMSAPIGVAKWTKTITTSLPADLTSPLPSIEELESELAAAPDDEPLREAT
jgi:hypothetical protein